jgi:hypothetical protein
MKTIDQIKRPVALVLLGISIICLSPCILKAQEQTRADQILTILQAQHAAARACIRRNQVLVIPYARRISQIDAAACPDDFFYAWQKYVSDVQKLSAIDRADATKAVVSIGVAAFTGNAAPLLGVIPQHPENAEITHDTAAADWQNVKHIALRYGIKFPLPAYSERDKVRGNS